MKKLRNVILLVLLCIGICVVAIYFVYGSTLINVTSEKSISNHLTSNSEISVNIVGTAQLGNYFGILYTDSAYEENGIGHFKYITKVPFYKNRYYNMGGDATIINAPYIAFSELNENDENRKTAEVFIYSFNSELFENNKCSVFKYNPTEYYIDFEEIKSAEEITEKYENRANSYEKVDEFDLPDDNVFIIAKTYDLDKPDDQIQVLNGSVSEDDIRKQIIAESDEAIKEFYEYLKGTLQ